MIFETKGDKTAPAILFFHAMGVTGQSSERVAENLKDKYFCIMPTSSVYCEGQKYLSKADELKQVEDFLNKNGVQKIALVVASSIGADIAVSFLSQTKIPVGQGVKVRQYAPPTFRQLGKQALASDLRRVAGAYVF